MRETLGFLHTQMEAPIPKAALADLGARRDTAFERFEQRVLGRYHRWLGKLPEYWCHHWRARDGAPLRAAATFAGYLQHAWGLPCIQDVPHGALTRVVRRLRARSR
jgi:hypothetical protein